MRAKEEVSHFEEYLRGRPKFGGKCNLPIFGEIIGGFNGELKGHYRLDILEFFRSLNFRVLSLKGEHRGFKTFWWFTIG